jgi:hypothetical protein
VSETRYVTDHSLRRDHLIGQAVQAGKFPPERRAHWQELYDRDPAGTEQTLAVLAPGLVGVQSPTGFVAGESPYPRELFPELVRADRRAQQAVSAPQAAPPPAAAVVHPRPAAPPQEASDATLPSELVGQWSREMFPEVALKASANSRVSRAND